LERTAEHADCYLCVAGTAGRSTWIPIVREDGSGHRLVTAWRDVATLLATRHPADMRFDGQLASSSVRE